MPDDPFLRSQDLVSLPVLRALLRERNVTRAGETLGLTQSATSNALARLRRRFDDDLLVRVGRRYELTPLAQTLQGRVEAAFTAAGRVFEDPFDPSVSDREFVLALSDYMLAVLADSLVSLQREEPPGIRMRFEQLSPRTTLDFADLLRSTDGVVLPPDYLRGFPRLRLFTDLWVCIVGAEAPVGQSLSIADLGRLPWVATFGPALASSPPPVRQLRASGVEPYVVMSVDGFGSAPALVAGTDRIAFLPQRFAARWTDSPGLRILPSPLTANDHLLSLYWDASATGDLGHAWLRNLLRRAADRATRHTVEP